MALIGLSVLAGCRPSPDQIYSEANQYFAEGKYKQALPLYEELLVRDANNVNLYPKLTLSYGMTKDWAKCAEFARESIARKADLYDVYHQGAYCQARLNKPKEALALYQEGMARFPDQPELKEEAAALYFREKQYDKASALFTQLADRYRRSAQHAYNAASVYASMGKYDLAETYYRRVLRLDPEHANAHYGLGSLSEKRGEPVLAVSHYQKALAARPDHLSALLNLAQLQEKQAPKAALAHWKQYLTLAQKKKQPEEYTRKAQEHIRILEGGSKTAPSPSPSPSKR